MITNGTISSKIITGGGLDSNGDPVAVTTSWGTPIECLIKTNTHSNNGKLEDGEFTMASYEVIIPLQDFSADRIKLVNDRGTILGEFQIQDIQFLDTVDRVKIQV